MLCWSESSRPEKDGLCRVLSTFLDNAKNSGLSCAGRSVFCRGTGSTAQMSQVLAGQEVKQAALIWLGFAFWVAFCSSVRSKNLVADSWSCGHF